MIARMSIQAIRDSILEGKAHRGGLKMQPCVAVDAYWFAALQEETRTLVATRASSDVGEKTHPTDWVRPLWRCASVQLAE